LREDEVKNKWDFNLYVYVGDRPVDSIDFTGLEEDGGGNDDSSEFIKKWCMKICGNNYRREVKSCKEKFDRCIIRVVVVGQLLFDIGSIALTVSTGAIGGSIATLIGGTNFAAGFVVGKIVGGGLAVWRGCYGNYHDCLKTAKRNYDECICDCISSYKRMKN